MSSFVKERNSKKKPVIIDTEDTFEGSLNKGDNEKTPALQKPPAPTLIKDNAINVESSSLSSKTESEVHENTNEESKEKPGANLEIEEEIDNEKLRETIVITN